MVLDKVYDKFKKLEKDYKKSKKSRSKFIIDRFGGDIAIGSTIILDSIYSENPSTQEDISKFSFVKDVINNILKSKDDLDYLQSFDFSEDISLEARVYEWLESIEPLPKVSQKDLYSATNSLHYYVDEDRCYEVPLSQCRFYNTTNPNIALILQGSLDEKMTVDYNNIYERQSNTSAKIVTEAKVKRVYK